MLPKKRFTEEYDMKRILPLALGGAMLLSLSVPAMATNATKNAWVNYSNVKIVADGAPIVPRAGGDSGAAVEPFVWNGTTYLPLRAAAAALGITVDWDGATSTISLTSGGKRIAPVGTPVTHNKNQTISIEYNDIKVTLDGKPVELKDATGKTVEPFTYNGTTYLPVRAVADLLGVSVKWVEETKDVTNEETNEVTKKYTQTIYLGEAKKFKLAQKTYGGDKNFVRYTYDEDGCELTYEDGYTIDGVESCDRIVHTYNNQHQKVKTVYEFDGAVSSTSTYTYDAKGQLVSEKSFQPDSPDSGEIRYTYDSKGNRVKETSLYNNEVNWVDTYTYDSKDNRIKTVGTNGEGVVVQTETYAYNSDGKLTKYTLEGDGFRNTETNTYDKNGYLIKNVLEYGGNTGPREVHTTVYTNDADGNHIKANYSEKYADGSGYSVVYTYTYDKGNKMLTESRGYYTTYYTYDKYGNLISEKTVFTDSGTGYTLANYGYVAIKA